MKNLRILSLGLALGCANLGVAASGDSDSGSSRSTSAAREPSPTSTQSTSSYTNSWEQSRVETTTTFASPSSFHHFSTPGWSSNYWGPTTHTRYYRVLNIKFPQEPVILAQWLPPLTTGMRPTSSVAAQMKPFLSERFYPALSALLHDESLSNKRLQKISDYRADKQRLLTELRAGLEEIRKADPSARDAMKAELARKQSEAIRSIEAREEEIRADLTSGSLFANSVDWNETRSWRLGDDSRYESYNDEYQVMRASVFFQDGLTTPQRDLLREVSMELLMRGKDPTSDIALDSTGPYFFFSPATTRIRLPLDMPEALRTKIDEYQELKYSIKQDLRNTVYRLDRAWLDSTRIKAFKALAAEQEPKIARLEQLAEEIRVGLAPLRYPDEPVQQGLPDSLSASITAYLQEKIDLQRSLLNKRTEVQGVLPKDRVEIVSMRGGYGIEIVAPRKTNKDTEARRETIKAELTGFNTDMVKRFQTLSIQKEKLRLEVRNLAGANSTKTRSMEQLQAEFSRSFARQEMWNRYKDYRLAVLEPGLSPEQRRLLFGAAIETLMGDYAN